ncbi:hypothetical protein [Kitasatospora sp. NPDC092286]
MNYSTGATGQGAHSNTVVPFGSRPTDFGPAVRDSPVNSLYGSY